MQPADPYPTAIGRGAGSSHMSHLPREWENGSGPKPNRGFAVIPYPVLRPAHRTSRRPVCWAGSTEGGAYPVAGRPLPPMWAQGTTREPDSPLVDTLDHLNCTGPQRPEETKGPGRDKEEAYTNTREPREDPSPAAVGSRKLNARARKPIAGTKRLVGRPRKGVERARKQVSRDNCMKNFMKLYVIGYQLLMFLTRDRCSANIVAL